jgi:dihydroflavonol-4-reductase
MIVAVTGASGHLGANLVRALLKENKTVRALVNTNRQALDGLKIDVIKIDVRDAYSLYKAFSGVEVVYHLAGVISLSTNDWKNVEAINVLGTHNVVDACLQCGVKRMIHFSSIHAIEQNPIDKVLDEKSPLVDSKDCPPYDRSKAAAEKEVRQGIEQGLDGVILNPTAIIGPWDSQPSFLGSALLAMAQGRMPALVPGGFDWVDARDVAAAAIKAEHKAPTGAKYILGGHWATVQDLAKIVEDLTGIPGPRLIVPTWLAKTGAPLVTAINQITRNRPIYTAVSIRALNGCNRNISHERATRELDFHPRQLEETISDTLHWFQDHGMLNYSQKKSGNKR